MRKNRKKDEKESKNSQGNFIINLINGKTARYDVFVENYSPKCHSPKSSGRPGSKFSPGRDRAGMTFIPAGTGTGTGIEMKTRPGPGLASSRPGPGPGFFQYFSISVKMKQCYMLNKIFQNKLRYVKLKLTVSSSQGRIQGGATGVAAPPPREIWRPARLSK